jgi:glycosyltransferase involved in cell wall biosynthesis
VHGYFRAETGVGQSARNGIEALTSAGIPFTVHNLQASLLSEEDRSIVEFSDEARHGANLYFVNADQTAVVHRHSAQSPRRRNIGFWTWELDELPREWDRAFDAYDEIWVPSSFCQAAIAAHAPIPVIRIPYCLISHVASRKQRQDFDIDSRHFVFLTVFDMRSSFDRKNPLGVLRAFKAAFPTKGHCELVVKVNHADSAPEKLACLRAEASGHSIRLIEETLRHEDVVDLIGASDCVVSLHRSEGFGLVLGEAMLLEKPVIATAYSGNLDFTTPSNSFLVSYTLKEVGPGNSPYPPHCLWANPCLKDACEQMKTVYENRQLREQRARAGRILIENQFSPAAVGAAMEARLRLIEQRR